MSFLCKKTLSTLSLRKHLLRYSQNSEQLMEFYLVTNCCSSYIKKNFQVTMVKSILYLLPTRTLFYHRTVIVPLWTRTYFSRIKWKPVKIIVWLKLTALLYQNFCYCCWLKFIDTRYELVCSKTQLNKVPFPSSFEVLQLFFHYTVSHLNIWLPTF